MCPTYRAKLPRKRTPKIRTWQEPIATRPADVGRKREMGLIGAVCSSETTVVGSGWLFGSWYAASAAGTAAILGWSSAESSSLAGTSFGFFSWVPAITVAPVEAFAVMEYAQYYWHGLYNKATSRSPGWAL